jgi:predicted XRE-type DNA-binding protein
MRSKSARGKRRNRTSNSRAGASPRSGDRGARPSDERSDDDDDAIPIIESSGNIFLDLGFEPAEAHSLLLRADLMNHITRMIRQRRLTQRAAAKLFGVTQPRISNLKQGKIDLFSIDGLIGMLAHAGVKVDLDVKPAAA